MILTCPNCATKFRIPDDKIGPDGRKVRCSNCGHVWRAMLPGSVPPAPPPIAEADPASGPVTMGAGLDDETQPQAEPEASKALAPGFGAPPASPDQPAAGPLPEAVKAPAPAKTPDGAAPGRSANVLGWALIVLSLGALLAGLFLARQAVMARLPQTIPLYDALGLVDRSFILRDEDAALREDEDGNPVLIIRGEIINIGNVRAASPALLVSVLRQGEPLREWRVPMAITPLDPGGLRRIEEVLADPPEGGDNVFIALEPPGGAEDG